MQQGHLWIEAGLSIARIVSELPRQTTTSHHAVINQGLAGRAHGFFCRPESNSGQVRDVIAAGRWCHAEVGNDR